ncbi:MAG: hypothetical protein GJ676_11310 [Rhodobacteraceae bacterium]|nr:hypothetical protein [Paracoccaceae bacterium]
MLDDLLTKLTDLARATDGLGWYADRMTDLPTVANEPQRQPVCDLVAKLDPSGCPAETAPATQAILDALPHLRWQQTYTEADGFSRHWLDSYGYANVISPEGPYLSDDLRVCLCYWGRGLHYSEHSHAPEETYVILAGQARFHAENRSPRDAGPGDTIHHTPHQKHAIDMDPGPLLVVAFWRGDDLLKKSDL